MTLTAPQTDSEIAFEAWCRSQGVAFLRIRESRIPGQKRPDYALRLRRHVPQLPATPVCSTGIEASVL